MKTGLRYCIVLLWIALSCIVCKAAPATIDSLRRFAGNIHQFNAIFPQEKVYLQFDNTSYYTGETIWFKAFVTSASDLSRAKSKVLYVDLVSPAGEVLQQQKLMIVAGQADGSMSLVDVSTAQARDKRGMLEYPSGFYEIRAYTSYMLNFDESIVFSRVFAVFEKPRKEGDFYDSNPTIRLRKTDNNTDKRPKTEKTHDINCSFYPEGGHLIIGKPCRVAFKVTDETGFGADAQVTLQDSGITFSTVHDGMGEFTFTPQQRRNQVTITAGGKSGTFSLPQAEATGLALKVEPQENDEILVTVNGTDDFKGATLGMTLTCRGELIDFGTIMTGSAPAQRTVSLNGAPEGVCRIHLFDSNGTLYASRSIYHHSLMTKSPVLEVTTDKESYAPFDKVSMSFKLDDGHGNPFRDRFCLAVRDVRTQGSSLADDLRTSMLLSSDLRGMIESPSWYFDSDSPERLHALDLLCMVQGWERYDWTTMTGQREFTEKHRIEESLTVNGWIMNSSGKKPLNDVEVNAALVPKDKKLTEKYRLKTDSTGYFGFDLGVDFYNKAKFSIGAHLNKKKRKLFGPEARIVFERSIKPAVRAYQPQELVLKSNLANNRKAGITRNEAEDEALPAVISQEKGYTLQAVDIEEERMYIDYFTFKAYDVVADAEADLDKGDYTTDLYGYLLEKGFNVQVDSSGVIDTINGFRPFFYFHTSNKYFDKGLSDFPTSIDAMDIKSIIVYDHPMSYWEIIQVCPLFDDFLNKGQQTQLGSITPLLDRAPGAPEEYADLLLDDLPNQLILSPQIDPRQLERRRILIDILVKENREQSLYSELFNINQRITTVDGYSQPYAFYSPEYPDGPIPGDVDYRRTIYWNPNVITDAEGKAQVEFYNSSITRRFSVSAAGITASGVPYILESQF